MDAWGGVLMRGHDCCVLWGPERAAEAELFPVGLEAGGALLLRADHRCLRLLHPGARPPIRRLACPSLASIEVMLFVCVSSKRLSAQTLSHMT